MAKKITQEVIIEINELYLKLGVKAQVARKVGCSASTVTKYLIPNYTSKDNIEEQKFEGEIPSIDKSIFQIDKLSSLCIFTDEEWSDLELLRKEILV